MANKISIQSDNFEKNRLFHYVQQFSFPRLAGTEGEKKAVELTVKTFKEIGFDDNQIQKEPFEFSDFYSTTLIKLIMTVSLTCILILVLLVYIHPFIGFGLIGGMALIVFLILRGLKHPETPGFWGKYYGTTYDATNVFIKIPAKSRPEHEAGNILLTAHIDSKSQTFKTVWRIIAYRIWLFGGILFGIVYITVSIYILMNRYLPFFLIQSAFIENFFFILNVLLWILTGLVSFSNILLMSLSTHNKSPGALDNASGMAIVFELSSFFKDHPLNNFNLWLCQFSAEELGTMGSRIFVNNHEEYFIKERAFQINFDMVSMAGHKRNGVEYMKSYGVYPRHSIAPSLNNYLEKAAEEKNLKITGFHLSTGAHTDSVPFHLRGFEAVDIVTRAAARYTHNKIDTPDKVDPLILLEACLIAKKAVILLDEDYNT
ncbi:MAG: M28 family peptidase [Promethearchaeota archaeon]|nr:MAG: M28 family peptidase [Candidatus Lokiarchaeota archaeon]